MRASRRRRRPYVLPAVGFSGLALVAIVVGTVFEDDNLSGPSHMAAIVGGLSLGLLAGTLYRAYETEKRVPALARQLTAMRQAMDAGEPVSGRFVAFLRVPIAAAPLRARWMYGRMMITPQSVLWVRRVNGRARDLTGAQCGSERKSEPAYTEMTLSVPDVYKGENVRVLTVHVNGADVELAAPASLLEIIRYAVGRRQ
jgi:hypothetical protein